MLDSIYDVIVELLPEYEQAESPVAVKYYSIFKDKNTGKFYTRLTFINVGKVQIAAFKLKLTCLDSLGEMADPNNSVVTFTLQDLAFPIKSEFKSNYISIGDLSNTRKLRVLIEKVLYLDGTEWIATNGNLNRTKSIKLPPIETQNLLKDRVGHDAIITPQQDEQFWYCVCGNRNTLLNTSCSRCGRDKNAVLSLDLLAMPSLNIASITNQNPSSIPIAESNHLDHTNVSVQQISFETKTSPNIADLNLKKKRKKLVVIISSGILVVMIAVLVVGWFFIPFIKYEYACFLFNHYRYEEAEVLFESMGNYSLSEQNRNFAIAEQIYTKVRQGAYQEAIDQIKGIDSSTTSYLSSNEVIFIEAYCLTALENNQEAYQLYKKIPNYYSRNLGKSANDGIIFSARKLFIQELEQSNKYFNNSDYINTVACLKRIDNLRQELDRLPVKNFILRSDIAKQFSAVKDILLNLDYPYYHYDERYVKLAYLKTGDDFNDGEIEIVFPSGGDFGLLTDGYITKYPVYVKWYKPEIDYLETEVKKTLITEHEPSNSKYPGWYFYFDDNNFTSGYYYAELICKTPYNEITIGYFPFEIN